MSWTGVRVKLSLPLHSTLCERLWPWREVLDISGMAERLLPKHQPRVFVVLEYKYLLGSGVSRVPSISSPARQSTCGVYRFRLNLCPIPVLSRSIQVSTMSMPAMSHASLQFGIEVELLLGGRKKAHSSWNSLANDLSRRLAAAGIANHINDGGDKAVEHYREYSIVREVTIPNQLAKGLCMISPLPFSGPLPREIAADQGLFHA